MSLGDTAGRGAPVAPSAPELFLLPDDVLLEVFAHFDESELLDLFEDPCDAASLAAAHPRLAQLYRCFVVTRLVVSVESGEVAQAQKVQLALHRYPRAEILHLFGLGRNAPVRVESFMGAQLSAVGLHGVDLGWDSFRALLRACPRLVVLRMDCCTFTAEGGEQNELAAAELQTWSRLKQLLLGESPEILRGLVSNRALFELHALRKLEISCVEQLQGSVFDACARLSKITKLVLKRSLRSSADAARILQHMPSLEELDVTFSKAITPALWGVLPPSLSVLRAGGTRLFRDADGNGLTGGCGGPRGALRVLDASISGLETWEALSSGFGELRELNLTSSYSLGDERVEDALSAMPHLEKLVLFICQHVGNRTAAAMAQHPRLSNIEISGTGIGASGIADLRRTFRPSGENWIRRR